MYVAHLRNMEEKIMKITPETLKELEEYLKQYNLKATIGKFNLKNEISDLKNFGLEHIDNSCTITITLNCVAQRKNNGKTF